MQEWEFCVGGFGVVVEGGQKLGWGLGVQLLFKTRFPCIKWTLFKSMVTWVP